jgi:cell wall-associated NlpC family hydrolase
VAEANIGASRLLGTNGLQQAVDSLENQIKRLSNDFSRLSTSIGNMSGTTNRSAGGSMAGNSWNTNSNRGYYSSNGGGGIFTAYATFGNAGNNNPNRRRNGGGGNFNTGSTLSGGIPNGGARFSSAVGMGASVMAGLTAYGNRNMSSNMQMDMAANYASRMGGIGPGGYDQSRIAAQRALFSNNYLGLNVNDMAAAGYINTYTFGRAAQNNGGVDPAYVRQMSQVQGFGYNSPTQGATGAATAAQESYTARSLLMSRAMGIAPTMGAGGVQTPMGDIARSIMSRSLNPGRSYTPSNIASALGQGGGLSVNLQYMGQQMGWSQGTIQEYRNYMTNFVNAQSKGMSAGTFDTLLTKAQAGNTSAQNQLKSVGVGSTMFETQRNLNSTRTTRQEDILESLAPAFNTATDVVNKFSSALTKLLQNTGLDKAIGTGAGWGSAISGGLGGFSGGLGAAGGFMTAMRLFNMSGGLSGGLGGLFGRGASAAGNAGGLLNATRGANGVYNITNLANGAGGASLLARGGPYAAAGAAVAGAGVLGWKGAVSSEANNENVWLQGMSTALKYNPADPLSAAYRGVGGVRRAYDKFITGKNKESFWSLLNPWGQEKRMTNTDGRSGGGAASNPAGGGDSGNSNGATNGSGATDSQIIQFAESQLGVPYVWGGTTPGKGFDCSGLIQWAYGKAGISLPRTSEEQQGVGTEVGLNAVQPGDLLFKGTPAHHVAMAIGGGKIIEAPHTGLNVRIRSFSAGEFTNAKRVVGNVGSAGSLLNGNTGNAVSNTLSSAQSRSGGNAGDLSGISERAVVLSALSGSIGSLPATVGAKSTGATSGTSQLGTTPTGSGGNDKSSLQSYARQLLSKYGWGDQWNSFDALVMSESGWDYEATNPTSGAYGIPQSLPGSKMSSAGSDWRTSGDTQLRWMMDYINDRYHSPNAAWSFHQKNNWYASGAWSLDQDQTAEVHKGEMILPAKQAETVRSAIVNAITNKSDSGTGTGITIGSIQVNLPVGYSGTRQEAQLTGKMIATAIEENTRKNALKIGQ